MPVAYYHTSARAKVHSHSSLSLQAVLATGVRLGGAGVGVSVVSRCDHATRVLQERAARAGIKILHTLQVEDATSLGRDVARFVTGQVVSDARSLGAADRSGSGDKILLSL